MSTRWMTAALDYIPEWLEFQMRFHEQPGCSAALVHKGKLVWKAAYGHANAGRGVPLTTRHRFRVASHSKTFTSAGFLKLREQGKVRLDDPVSQYLSGLHRSVGEATIGQLLSHSAGIVRDGFDSGQWADRRPFLSERELLADLEGGTTLPPSSRFKYSNHGDGLAGLVLEAITGESYGTWIQREIVDAAGLGETYPDTPLPKGVPMASGHSTKVVLGHRRIVPGDNPTHALAPATGFVSTATDLATFFAHLAPNARRSILSPASRREMVRRQWTSEHSRVERHYGYGTISGRMGDWNWFGHSGGFQGFITNTAVIPAQDLSLSILTNAADGMSGAWLEGAVHVLRAFHEHGAPTRRAASWGGRWWSLWGATDFIPMGSKVYVGHPSLPNPLMDAGVIEPTGRDTGRIALDNGFANHGEMVRRVRNAKGNVAEFWYAGGKLVSERRLAREMETRYKKR
ncbi:MAG: serine hydrolase domain-containing protein [Candidatus Eisenbacteria bacterium]